MNSDLADSWKQLVSKSVTPEDIPGELGGLISDYATVRAEALSAPQDACYERSEEFARCLRTFGMKAKTVSGVAMASDRVISAAHTATVAIDFGMVVDWTARQFDPQAPLPLIVPLRVWREFWQAL